MNGRAIFLLLIPLADAIGSAPVQAGVTATPVELRIGVMTHFAHGWDPSLSDLVAAAGITQVRDELYWQAIEEKRGEPSIPATYDHYMQRLERDGISPLIVLSFENNAYDDGATPYSADGMSGYAHYALVVLRHYGKQISAVEIWNEYNGSFAHGAATEKRAETYLAMLREVYHAIKAERPDVTIVGGVTSGTPLPYWEKLLNGGILATVDAISIHPYHYDAPPEQLQSDLARLRKLVARYDGGERVPLWVSEIGWYTKASRAKGDLAIDEDTQARFLVRAFALLLSANVERVYWYLLRDNDGMAMGLVHDDPGLTRKRAYWAMSTLIRELRQAHFVRRDPTPPDLYSIVFARDSGEEIRVLWALRPQQIDLRGVTTAVNLVGKKIAEKDIFSLDDSPIFVTGRLRGLPPPPSVQDVVLTQSVDDFAATQGNAGWFYGAAVEGEAFKLLPDYRVDDWQAVWSNGYPYLSIGAGDQHPSVFEGKSVAVVRRWSSPYDGAVRIAGEFRCGTSGDGVGVRIVIDGNARCEKQLGVGGDRGIVDRFDFVETLHAGSVVDFVVDPGPATNIDNDATSVSVTITALKS